MPGRGGATKNFYLPLARKHVMAERWKDEVGTDFWMMPNLLTGTVGDTTAGVAGGNRLFDNGWSFEAEHAVIGAASEFRGGAINATGALDGGPGPTTPGIPTHFAFLATGDIVVSPPIFGGYDHMLAASWLVGKDRNQLPTKLIMECRAAFTTNSNNEPTSGFGFFEDGTTTTTATEALQLAFISSDGTNFQLATNASSTLVDVGALVKTTWAEWRIVIDFDTGGTIRASWYIDGVLQGSIVPTTNEAPYAFGGHVLSNVLLLGPVHIYYDWGVGRG